MRNIEKEVPVSISQMLAEDEQICKEITGMIVTNIGGEMSEEEATLRGRLRQIRSLIRDSLDPDKRFFIN